MRTTVVLDDDLVQEARKVLGQDTLRGVIEFALREAIKARQREALLLAIADGSIEMVISESDLEQMRRDRQLISPWIAEGFGAPAPGSAQ